MARGNRMRVVIVVPALAKGDERDQEIVSREVFGCEAARSPEMRNRVHHPGGVQSNYDAGKDSPEEPGQSAEGEEDNTEDDVAGPVILGEPDVNFIFGQIRNVAPEGRG